MIIPVSEISPNIILGEQIPAFCSAISANMKKSLMKYQIKEVNRLSQSLIIHKQYFDVDQSHEVHTQ